MGREKSTKVQLRHDFANPGVEAAVAALVLQNPELLLDVEAVLHGLGFLTDMYQELFRHIHRLYHRGNTVIDINLLKTEIEMNSDLDRVGGLETLKALYDKLVDPVNFDYYLSLVKEAGLKYRLHLQADNLVDTIYANRSTSDEAKTADALISEAEQGFLSIAMGSTQTEEPVDLADRVEEILKERVENPKKIIGLPTGFPILDDAIDGLQSGKLYIISGRLKGGKSVFLLSTGVNVAYKIMDWKNVLYIDTEMDKDEHLFRSLGMLSGVPVRSIERGTYYSDPEFRNRVDQAKKVMDKGRFHHKYFPSYTLEGIGSIARKWKKKHGIGLLIFDYIKIPYGMDSKSLAEWQQLGGVTTYLKELSKELEIPIIAGAQLNREADEKSRVATRMVGGSDRILQFADAGMALIKKTSKEIKEQSGGIWSGNRRVSIIAARGGGEHPGIDFIFYKSQTRLEEVRREYQTMMDQPEETDEYEEKTEDVVAPTPYINDEDPFTKDII